MHITHDQRKNYLIALESLGVHSWAAYYTYIFKSLKKANPSMDNPSPMTLSIYGYLVGASQQAIKPWRQRIADEDANAYAQAIMSTDFGSDFVRLWHFHEESGGMGPWACVCNMVYNGASDDDINAWLMDYMHDFKVFVYETLENSYKEDIIEASVAMSDMRTQREALTRHYTPSEIYATWKG